MRIFDITLILFGLFFLGCRPKPKANADRPNIILLIGDDQGYPYFGFMGADYVHTPNMDALAASGTLFATGSFRQSLPPIASDPFDYPLIIIVKPARYSTHWLKQTRSKKRRWMPT